MHPSISRGFLATAIAAAFLGSGECAAAAEKIVTPAPGSGAAARMLMAQLSEQAGANAAILKTLDLRQIERTEVSFQQLGARDALMVWRTGGMIGLPFSVRADEVITAARLRVNFWISPQLPRQTAQLTVTVNGEPAGTISLRDEQPGTNIRRDLNVDPRLITDFNRISLQLDSTTSECIEPGKGEPLLRVNNGSALELQALRLPIANDLALLPLPFFDSRDPRRLELPFAFVARPSNSTLEAASILSSWFGWQAGYRGAIFPASLTALPKGNAVVFATASEMPAGLNLPAPTGPSLAVMENPTDERGKLLIVMGRDGRELKAAASALALGNARVSGQSSIVVAPTETKPRAAYDAAHWVPTNRPVKLGELADVRRLNVSGGVDPEPVRLNLRVPPDIFAWRSEGVPIDLKYRYIPKALADQPVLNINVNNEFVETIPLRADFMGGGWRSWFGGWFGMTEQRQSVQTLADGTFPGSKRVIVPGRVVGPQSYFNLEYDFDYAGRATCKQVLDTRIGGGIDPDSTIDLSGFSHFLPMPNLAAFSNAGYPFSRVADLSETAVMLPDAPSAGEIGVMLTAMGRMGESTGYPATNVAVVHASEAATVAGRDLLVVGGVGNQPLLQQLSRSISADLSEEPGPFKQAWDRFVTLLKAQGSADRASRIEPVAVGRRVGDATMVGFESPYASGRSVVALFAGRDPSMVELQRVLTDPAKISKVHGSAVAVGPESVELLNSDTTYYVGNLPPVTWLHWYFSKHPIRLWVCALIAVILLAVLLHRALGGIATRRLRTP
jgi:cellulose synthase operon protein B